MTTQWANPLKIPRALKRMLGQPPADPNLDAWTQLIAALRDSTQASWNATLASYMGLKKVRADLGLEFMVGPPGGEGYKPDPGAWTPELDQQAVDLAAMVKIATDGASDVLANKRELVYVPALQDFVVKALPTDVWRVGVMNGKPVLVDAKAPDNFAAGDVKHGSGTVGILPLIIAGGIIGNGLIALGVYAVIKESLATVRKVSENKMLTTLSNNEVTKIKAGVPPAEAAAQTKALLDGAEAIKKQDVALAQASGAGSSVADWTGLIKTAGVIGLIGFGLYIAAQLIPKGGTARSATATP